MIDTHAHLDALEDPAAALERARAAGVTRVITIGAGIESARRALELAAGNGVFAAVGIDPHQAGTGEAARTDELRDLLGHPKVVAVGEAGLDYHYGADRKDEQRTLFEAQLALAALPATAAHGGPVDADARTAGEAVEADERGHNPGSLTRKGPEGPFPFLCAYPISAPGKSSSSCRE